MKFRFLTIIFLLTACLVGSSAQDSKFFRNKLGKPAELYQLKSGLVVQVAYDDKGQACSIVITDPTETRLSRSFPKLQTLVDELVPTSSRGKFLGRTGEIGNCTEIEFKDYERVFVQLNRNFCYEQSVRILFKRPTCAQPPVVPGLMPN